jgi:hypothetical protein
MIMGDSKSLICFGTTNTAGAFFEAAGRIGRVIF